MHNILAFELSQIVDYDLVVQLGKLGIGAGKPLICFLPGKGNPVSSRGKLYRTTEKSKVVACAGWLRSR